MKNSHHEDFIIRSVSDKESLSDSELTILENSDNKKEAEDLQSDLNIMTKTSADFSPGPLNSIFIPQKQTFSSTFLRPALSCGIAVLFLIVIYQFSIPGGSSSINIDAVYQEITIDEVFMTEVETLVGEVAYSDFYPDASAIKSRYNFSDEFIDAIVPI